MDHGFGRTRIKVCGVRSYEIAMAAVEAGADAIGFVFVPTSKRYIEPAAAYEIMINLPPMVATVGVFKDQSVEEFLDIEETCPTTYTQLDGDEPQRFVQQVGPDVLRMLKFDAEATPQALMVWDAVDEVGGIVIEGNGLELGPDQWTSLAEMMDDVAKPLFLGGGVHAGNVGEAIRIVRPYAVDVSSGVEIEKGSMDPEMIAEFCRAVREADGA